MNVEMWGLSNTAETNCGEGLKYGNKHGGTAEAQPMILVTPGVIPTEIFSHWACPLCIIEVTQPVSNPHVLGGEIELRLRPDKSPTFLSPPEQLRLGHIVQ